MKISRRARTWLIAIAAPLIFVIAFTVVVVSYAHFHTPPSVNVTTTSFSPQTIEIPAGGAIHFVNQSSTTQIICAGSNQQCQSSVALSVLQSPPPQALLSPGVQIAPNQAKNVVFDTEGIYHLTNAVGNMNLTVTVDATS
ncbi:MAG TPA: hypothetical protein VGT82_17365 [Ktedonobacteraceae bacterium]|nr:hypothetical protein [Ktedonobacteraceae bacterium]